VRIFLVGGSAAYGDTGGYPEIDARYSYIYNSQLIDYYLQAKLNAAFPSRHWEVINAATMEYRLHQELGLIESSLLRYHPDYIILMDGYNDLATISSAPSDYDPYASTPHMDEFDLLANPSSGRSFLFFTTTWLKANSAFFRSLSDHLQERFTFSRREQRGGRREFEDPVRSAELTPEEQAQFATSRALTGHYARIARQIHRILDLDGVKALFLLQPVLILSHKPLTDSERKMLLYNLRLDGPLLAYDFEQLYPEIARQMEAAGAKDGFSFLDLTGVFNKTLAQTFSDYCHLTPEGNAVIADSVFDYLQHTLAEYSRAPVSSPGVAGAQ